MFAVRALALSMWAFATWGILTWTATASQLLFGAAFAVIVALALAPLGDVARPWRVLVPRRAVTTAALGVTALVRVVKANLSLARRIWSPALPLRTGMVIVPTWQRTEGGMAAVGLITSVIVDNQIVDVDLERQELLYHGVWIPDGEPEGNFERINGPVERYVAPLADR